jgi:hypothetical protein
MKEHVMNKVKGDANGMRRWRISSSKILGLFLILFYLPYCTAEGLDLPDAPVPSAPSVVAVQGANAPQQQTQNESVPSQAQPTPDQSQQEEPPRTQTPQMQTTQTGGQSQTSGVAAAPYIHPDGIAGSRPAGAAIAPAKQRRRRIFAVRIGLLVGAAIAIGTVVALSKSSPGRAN